MKRHDPKKRGLTEQRFDSNRVYGACIHNAKKQASKINPVFLQDNYGIKKATS